MWLYLEGEEMMGYFSFLGELREQNGSDPLSAPSDTLSMSTGS